jgi:DNA-binding MarR family transcriptional regulator
MGKPRTGKPWIDDDPLITGEVELDLGLRQKTKGRFVKGPLLLEQLAAASRLPGKALALLLLVRHRADVSRKRWATIPQTLAGEFGISPDAKHRAMRQLEAVGFVRLERVPGYRTRVYLAPTRRGKRERKR